MPMGWAKLRRRVFAARDWCRPTNQALPTIEETWDLSSWAAPEVEVEVS